MIPHSTRLRTRAIRPLLILSAALVLCCGCSRQSTPQQRLRLATTTSTRDSGLLDQLLPPFEIRNNTQVDVIAAGTGKALKLGERGDVDVLFVHAREAEDAFMEAGHGSRREDVMYNTFELLGPPDDPAEIRDLDVTSSLERIAAAGAPFVSRGDDSGTHKREMQLWEITDIHPDWPQYQESGQGMGATLTIADQKSAYVLTDRGTYLKFRDKIDLIPLAKQSPPLHNPYGVIVVTPQQPNSIRAQLAHNFVDWLVSQQAQQLINDYRVEDEQLFIPLSLQEPAEAP